MSKHVTEITRKKPCKAQQSVLQLKLNFGFNTIVYLTEFIGGLLGFASMWHGVSDTGGTTDNGTTGGTTGGTTTTE
ncbi:MAG TPA: hypothetical protein PKY35_01155 [Candidatus Hydrogenedentes bacterium]|nr:hypothetical protein [Candidatus Hydrogenedentota bacterium]HOL75609.1 hypothetical protein [Candidatus Hydrogenedentota bacterium]HPO84398.1 hypothetical protein [Candidatus Hydrogenedentota bacterium]